MLNNEKIGIGILTYNRENTFRQLFDSVSSNDTVDFVAVVKNKDIDYHENDPKFLCISNNQYYENVPGNPGIGFCKNILMRKLLDNNCQHIFIIEDDINIKNPDVFRKYIETAKNFKLEHLNFCRAFDSITQKYLYPFVTITGLANNLQLFTRLCGDFQYFTANALHTVGLFDERYVNALEHAEHTYRLSKANLYTPFNAFADIENSNEYIEDLGINTSINKDDSYNNSLYGYIELFKQTHGLYLKDVPKQNIDTIKQYFGLK